MAKYYNCKLLYVFCAILCPILYTPTVTTEMTSENTDESTSGSSIVTESLSEPAAIDPSLSVTSTASSFEPTTLYPAETTIISFSETDIMAESTLESTTSPSASVTTELTSEPILLSSSVYTVTTTTTLLTSDYTDESTFASIIITESEYEPTETLITSTGPTTIFLSASVITTLTSESPIITSSEPIETALPTPETSIISRSLSVVTTSDTAESKSASLIATESISAPTTAFPSPSVTPTTSMFEPTIISPPTSILTTELTSESTLISPYTSILTTELTSEPTLISPSTSILTTELTSESTLISPYTSILTTELTSETTLISPSTSILTTESTSESTRLSSSASFATTISTSASVEVTGSISEPTATYSSETITSTASRSESATISLSSSIAITTVTSETATISPSASMSTISATFQPTTTPSASIVTTEIAPEPIPTSSSTSILTSSTSSSTPNTRITTPTVTVDLGGRNLGLNFSIKVNISFIDDYKNKRSPLFNDLAKNFTNKLTPIYQNAPGFKYIEINEFRKGSTIANYSVIVSALINVTDVIYYINDTVLSQLKSVTIYGVDVDSIYLDQNMNTELVMVDPNAICKLSTTELCPFGFSCSDLGAGRVSCSDRCNELQCVHGTCYIDHMDGNNLKCRCPIDDDGYVYSGVRCEHKSLSTLIVITSAVGGSVLIAACFIVCLICIKMGRNRKQLDAIPLDDLPNYSQYFAPDSTYQPQYGYDLPLGRRKSIESRDLAGTHRYIPARDDGQENMAFFYEERFGDYGGDPIRERQTYDYIGMDTKFEIKRPQFR